MAGFERDGQHLAATARRNHDRPRLTTPPKSKPWSHQDDLKDLIGKKIELRLCYTAAPDIVDLIAADAFTIKVAYIDRSTLTFFKHSVIAFGPAGV